jgi:hypothetical protein
MTTIVIFVAKMTQVIKVKTVNTPNINPGELLHMDLAFWDVLSHQGFLALLMIIDAKNWLFCTTIKKPPLHILRWFFTSIRRENRHLVHICVDEDGALPGSTAFCKYIRDEEALNIETTGCYASYLNVKIERPNRTIAERVLAC